MLTSLISLYIISALSSSDLPVQTAQSLPWDGSNLLTAEAVPQKKPENISPVIKAKSAIAVDLKSGYILFEKNIFEPRAIASLTKLMTATIILEENNLNDVVTVTSHATTTPGSKIWLAPGEKITIENLLYGALVSSGNDAAVALAEYNSGNVDSFIQKMNQKALELGLYQTSFINPTGLDIDQPAQKPTTTKDTSNNNGNGQSAGTSQQVLQQINKQEILPKDNYSTAYDLSLLARYAYGKSFVRRAAVKKEMEIASTNDRTKHKLENTNALLDSYLKVLGLKTGTTDEAGECLITVIENEHGNQILTVILDSPDRYKETKLLADWIFRSYTW